MGVYCEGFLETQCLLPIKGCYKKQYNRRRGFIVSLKKSINLDCMLVLLKDNAALAKSISRKTKHRKQQKCQFKRKVFFTACQFFKMKSSRNRKPKSIFPFKPLNDFYLDI